MESREKRIESIVRQICNDTVSIGDGCEMLNHLISLPPSKEVVSDEEIKNLADYVYPNIDAETDVYLRRGFFAGFKMCLSRLSNVTDKSDAVDINFVVWYSGMKEEQVKKALERYKREVIYKQSKTK